MREAARKSASQSRGCVRAVVFVFCFGSAAALLFALVWQGARLNSAATTATRDSIRSSAQNKFTSSVSRRLGRPAAPPPPDPRHPISGDLTNPFPGETVPLTVAVVELTGHPPLLARSDLNPGGPDFETKGAPVSTSFLIADPPKDGGDDRVYAYVVRSEDTNRDILLALLTSPGRVRGKRDATDGPPAGPLTVLPAEGAVSCKASPVTWRYWCRAALARSVSGLFPPFSLPLHPPADGVHTRAPPPDFKSTRLWSIDAGSTAAGYYGLLSASLGVPAIVVEPQPQCEMWARTAAAASGLSNAVASLLTVPAGIPGGFQSIPTRTGCQGTSTIEAGPGADALAQQYAAYPRALLNATRVPLQTLDAVVDELEAAAGHPPRSVLFLVVKIDATGWEDVVVLSGMAGLLKQRRVGTVVVEINKQHLARRLRLGGGDAFARNPLSGDISTHGTVGFVPARSRAQAAISPADNAVIAAHIAAFARSMFAHGFQLLTADRGWFSAQDPFDAATDAAKPASVDEWADKLMLRGEVDLFFVLPDSIPLGVAGGK